MIFHCIDGLLFQFNLNPNHYIEGEHSKDERRGKKVILLTLQDSEVQNRFQGRCRVLGVQSSRIHRVDVQTSVDYLRTSSDTQTRCLHLRTYRPDPPTLYVP